MRKWFMSLTSHLGNSESPIGGFFHKRFPGTSAISREANARLKGSPTILPVSREAYPYGLIGTAVDYRLRYYLDVSPAESLVAYRGANTLMTRAYLNSSQLPEEFFANLAILLKDAQPVGRLLENEAEANLARYCFALALFEYVVRKSTVHDLLASSRPKTVEDILGMAKGIWIDDLCDISRRFYDTQSALFSMQFVLNPVFSGSGDVGGADADIIVDGCLIEIKTSIRPLVESQWLRQLAGYALLDYEDRYSIRSIGIYMARQGLMMQWPIQDYMRLLADDSGVTVESLRYEFRKVVLTATGERKTQAQVGS
jgi:hypothetical protein